MIKIKPEAFNVLQAMAERMWDCERLAAFRLTRQEIAMLVKPVMPAWAKAAIEAITEASGNRDNDSHFYDSFLFPPSVGQPEPEPVPVVEDMPELEEVAQMDVDNANEAENEAEAEAEAEVEGVVSMSSTEKGRVAEEIADRLDSPARLALWRSLGW